jgi:ribosomal protein S18 acetylase RimI-like enzyme
VNATSDFVCEPLSETNAPALAALFERVGTSCYCSYWHFAGNTNAWLARLAFEPDVNRSELFARARTPPRGVVARAEDDSVVGWMKLEPATNLSKIYAQRVYRGLPELGPTRDGVWSIGCFLVDGAWRRRGVARALVRAGVELGRAGGARAIEALPRRADDVRDEELFTGPFALFASEGFYVVHEQAQYPVLRRDL